MNVFGIGTEIIECVRIAKMIERHGELFLERVYTVDEVDFCNRHAFSIQQYAARWAAKEATVKAIRGRSQGIRWNQIELNHDAVQGPWVKLNGRADQWATKNGIERIQISFGSCRTHATAFAIAIAASPPHSSDG
ncbi:MAG TPA: holo-[acyl-carrier-protein] synthase [Planctomycetaceae bacterium]|nr:holo-[acyl-carrier-protein] synthase [Planctomycetaceae bacterium]